MSSSPRSTNSANKRTRGEQPEAKPTFDWSQIEVISFDLDDTLWHCEPVINKAEEALLSFLKARGHLAMCDELQPAKMQMHALKVRMEFPEHSGNVSFIRKQVLKQIAMSHEETLARDAQECDLVCQQAFEEFFHHRTAHVSEHFFPGSIDALHKLRALGLRLGTISNGNAQVERIPELSNLIEHHVSPALHEVKAKPYKDPFDMLRARFGDIDPSKVLHVGDSVESDVLGAIGAGMKSCWINLHGEDESIVTSKGCDLVVRSVVDLASMLEAHVKKQSTGGGYRFS